MDGYELFRSIMGIVAIIVVLAICAWWGDSVIGGAAHADLHALRIISSSHGN